MTCCGGEAAGRFAACASAPRTLFSRPSEIIAGMLAGEVVVARVEEHALVAAGVIDDAGAELARRRAHRTTSARTELVPKVNTEGNSHPPL